MSDDNGKYNGWTNYATWAVKLWMDNDERSYRHWNAWAARVWSIRDNPLKWESGRETWVTPRTRSVSRLADALKESHEADAHEKLGGAGVFSDLMGSILGQVNWQEIAEALIDDAEEAEPEQGDEGNR